MILRIVKKILPYDFSAVDKFLETSFIFIARMPGRETSKTTAVAGHENSPDHVTGLSQEMFSSQCPAGNFSKYIFLRV